MSKIEWTQETYNPIIGCSKVSAGCDNCYAEKMALRLANIYPTSESYGEVINYSRKSWRGNTYFVQSQLNKPLKRKKPTMYFVCSMGDLFHESVPFEWQFKVFQMIHECPHHTFQILTKRPDIMKKRIDDIYLHLRRNYGWAKLPLPNVWLGTTAENQAMANRRLPYLLEIPAVVRFISVEPMIGPVDLTKIMSIENRLDWVICGGESGSNARPMHPNWVRDLRDQCKSANVPFFFKQGSQNNWSNFKKFELLPNEFKIRQYPNI